MIDVITSTQWVIDSLNNFTEKLIRDINMDYTNISDSHQSATFADVMATLKP